MNPKEYILLLGTGVRKRHRHETEQGRVVAFIVQLEINHLGIWMPILRYDSAHGRSHIDRYNFDGEQEKEWLNLTFEETLTFADVDINKNWENYKQRFLQGLFP